MNKRFAKISEYLKIEKLKNNKQVIAFLTCLLIATALWFLNALGKDYTTTISYPVKYVNPPANHFLANEPPAKIDLKVNAHGFTLLRHKLSFSFSPIVLNLTNITNDTERSAYGYNINTVRLIRRISDQVSSEISINDVFPENFFVELDSLNTKLVPVKTNIELSFKPQFNLREPVSTNPDEIELTGPAAILDTIQFLYTEDEIFDKLDATVEQNLEIIYPENTLINPEEVVVIIPVEKYTEKDIKVPVQIKNKPENTTVKLFPSEVKLTVLVGLSEFEDISSSNFVVSVDFENTNIRDENLSVTVQSNLSHLQILRFLPESVEYLIETN